MRFFLYAFGINVYHFMIYLMQPFNAKARAYVRGRKGQLIRIKDRIAEWKEKEIIWIHAASYGEFEMAKPIIHALANKNKKLGYVISFHSPSGFEQTHFDTPNFLKIYLPKDLLRIQLNYVQTIKPKAVIFIKYEFWFNLLRSLNKAAVPYYFTSLHLNQNSYLFKWWMRPFEKYIKGATRIYAHNPISKDILERQGYQNVRLFGDSRIDQVLKNKSTSTYLNWSIKRPCIVFGSILQDEEKYICDFIKSKPQYNYIIAPHDIDNKTIGRLGRELKKYDRYSQIKVDNQKIDSILIVDTMGDLKNLYVNADLSYVGGGFDKGPHNVLEPLVFNSKVLCGPHIQKFPMAQMLVTAGLLTTVDRLDNLSVKILNLIGDNTSQYENAVSDFIDRNKSKLEVLVDEILNELDD